ncbi:HNH endonuclease [Aquamicrobium segne]|uniref:HNH endonuclease n=1 Tax=Aquamicrobium segne TaxID=469547 RepID=A0ABW0H0N7_9HYPH
MKTRFYDTAEWQRIRLRQLRREPMCRQCSQPAQHADHITPISRGGAKRDAANLQSLCHPCHNQKTGLERQGKTWRLMGCDEHGMPRDPSHPWHGGGGSITGSTDATPTPPTQRE